MKRISFVLALGLAFSLIGCTKQPSTEGASEPVEGASSAATEKAAENPSDEMQEKDKKEAGAASGKEGE